MRCLLLILPVLMTAGCSDATRINAGGASFVYPAMLKWTRIYETQTGVQVDYQSTGSGNGQQQTVTKTIDFGCTDAFIKDDLLDKAAGIGGEMLHIPLVMGGVVPIYNLPEAKDPLNFSGPVLAKIFLGEIKDWNHPDIQAINPGVALPQEKIVVVSRADKSGTTAIFTDYLSKVSPEWKDKVGASTSVKWPVGVAQRGNEGVAGHVGRSAYAIGYVELIYAIQNKVSYGAVETRDSAEKAAKAGKPRTYLQANLAGVTAAAEATLADLKGSKDEKKKKSFEELRYSLTYSSGAGSYPISGTNWAVIYRKQRKSPGEEVVKFLRWITKYEGEGQQAAKDLGYAPLPKLLSEIIEQKLSSVEFE